MPDTFEAMAAGADDDRGLLASGGAPAQRRQVVGHDLERVEQIVEVLDLGDRAQPAQGHPDRLADDRELPDAGVRDPQVAVLLLQVREALVDVAQTADVLTQREEAWLALESGVEAGVED